MVVVAKTYEAVEYNNHKDCLQTHSRTCRQPSDSGSGNEHFDHKYRDKDQHTFY